MAELDEAARTRFGASVPALTPEQHILLLT